MSVAQETTRRTAVTGPFADLDAQLRLDGYRPGRPAAFIAADDQLLCTLQACRRCRTTGLDYRPYLRPGDDGARPGYRMLAACRECGEAVEF